MTTILYGTGDDPIELSTVWLETCYDKHPAVTYIAGCLPNGYAVARCPACAALIAKKTTTSNPMVDFGEVFFRVDSSRPSAHAPATAAIST